MRFTVRLGLAVAIAAASLTACSSEDPTPSASKNAAFTEMVNTTIEQARRAGASDEQLTILDQISAAGSVSYDVYSAAVDRTLRCVRDAGVEVLDRGVQNWQGVQVRNITYMAASDGRLSPEVEKCEVLYSRFVTIVYENQPSAVEAQDRHFAEFRTAILDCLKGQGVAVDAQMTKDEILSLVAKQENQDQDCLTSTGFSAG